jgi:lipopolysaccharide transport system ATP-binding protein
MKNDVILSVENVSKLYRLGTLGTGTFGGDVQRFWKTKVLGQEDPFLKIGQTNDRTSKEKAEFVWALQDINFEVKRGEVLGIIGKNGAGKSTLLKLLSRITAPTTGSIKSAGRMASLLEVGTGFHPELTGRENVFLNGAILGMTKREIQSKFDEIVDFSGCELYIDTPVKRYSSGMTVRLGFAVAAFLDPEILVVDEVLAVGDAEFQKKAIGKMKEVSAGGGRTVLFVSHNMASIKALCTSAIVIEKGKLSYGGNISDAVNYYLQNEKTEGISFNYISEIEDSSSIFLKKASIVIDEKNKGVYRNDQRLCLAIEVQSVLGFEYSVEVLIKNVNLEPIVFSPLGFFENGLIRQTLPVEEFTIDLVLPFLASGTYFLDIMLVDPGKSFHEICENCLTFDVDGNYFGISNWDFRQSRGQGSILIKPSLLKNYENG